VIPACFIRICSVAYMYIYRILVTIICSLMLYPEYSVTEESIKDVVTTSKRTLPTEEKKKQGDLRGTEVHSRQLFNGNEVKRSFKTVDNPWQCLHTWLGRSLQGK